MVSDGRIEKRAAVKVPVHIVPTESAFTAETTTMVNISRRGARLLSSRRWHSGEQLRLTSMSGEFRREAKVIYCHPFAPGQFCVGLEFSANGNGNSNSWKDTPWFGAT